MGQTQCRIRTNGRTEEEEVEEIPAAPDLSFSFSPKTQFEF